MSDDLLPPELALDHAGPSDAQLADPGGFDLEPIADDEWAEWAGRRLAAACRRIDTHENLADTWIERIKEWEADVTAADRRIVERLTASLEAYAVVTRQRDGRATVKLPSVTIATTLATQPRVEITDEKSVLVWASSIDDGEIRDSVIATHPTVLVTGLRAFARIITTEDGDRVVVSKDGEIIPGVTIVDPEPKPRVTPRLR